MNNKILENKVIIVTGGKGLLGREMVSNIRLKGGIAIAADINLTTDIDKGELFCDITSMESIKDGLSILLKHYRRLDGLVNNAYPRTNDWGADFLSISEESLKNNIDWQLSSYMLFCQQAIKYMLKQGSGTIVNIASIYGVVGNDFTIYERTQLNPPAAYSAIKGGLINFTRYLASKYGKYGIRVNSLSPGGILDNQPERFIRAYEKKVPMKRLGNPKDIAPAVSFLLSDEAKYITGHNLIVDGGWTCI